jgi:hypothetical protein
MLISFSQEKKDEVAAAAAGKAGAKNAGKGASAGKRAAGKAGALLLCVVSCDCAVKKTLM